MSKQRILIVEDEADLSASIDYTLAREGFSTRIAMNGREALDAVHGAHPPNLVLLDLMLPDLPGIEVCRRIREDPASSSIPVVMVTARASEGDKVIGFEAGADDYVTKPFSPRELVLRVKAVLRRTGPTDIEPSLEFGPLRLDPGSHRTWINDEEIVLTALEFRLLRTFLERRGRVQTRSTLLDEVWGLPRESATRTVDTHVKRLRRKLGPVGHYVETIHGVGYRFRAES